jgi:hypothetical protein
MWKLVVSGQTGMDDYYRVGNHFHEYFKWKQVHGSVKTSINMRKLMFQKANSCSLTSSLLKFLWQSSDRAPTGNPGESWAASGRCGWCLPIAIKCGWWSPSAWFTYLLRGWRSWGSSCFNCRRGPTVTLGHWAAAIAIANFWSLCLSFSLCFSGIPATPKNRTLKLNLYLHTS